MISEKAKIAEEVAKKFMRAKEIRYNECYGCPFFKKSEYCEYRQFVNRRLLCFRNAGKIDTRMRPGQWSRN